MNTSSSITGGRSTNVAKWVYEFDGFLNEFLGGVAIPVLSDGRLLCTSKICCSSFC